jgi:hypothetical protein
MSIEPIGESICSTLLLSTQGDTRSAKPSPY